MNGWREKINSIELSEPKSKDSAARIEMTASCRDSDVIPKVKDAGQVVVENGTRLQMMHNGLRVLADGYCGPWMTELIERCRGHHEPQEEVVFYELLKHMPARAMSSWVILARNRSSGPPQSSPTTDIRKAISETRCSTGQLPRRVLESSAIERWRFRWKRALAETRQMRSRFRRRGGG